MMDCDEQKLKEIIIEGIKDETGVAGVPIEVAEKRALQKSKDIGMRCTLDQVRNAIRKLLDSWDIDKTIDELDLDELKEFGLPEVEGFTWHLKFLTPEKKEFYQSLKPKTKSLIKLLREQNNPERLGAMPQEEAIRILMEQGFEDGLDSIYAEDTIEEFGTIWDGKSMVWCYGLVKEYEKTEEYKKWREERDEESFQREAQRYRREEEFVITDVIYGHLDELIENQADDLDRLLSRKSRMKDETYLRKKAAIENRDNDEEKRWQAIIVAVDTLNMNDLIALQRLFREGKLPPLEQVEAFLRDVLKKAP